MPLAALGTSEMRLGVWILERLMETIGVSIAIVIIEGPLKNISDSLIEEVLRTTFFPLMFYMVSGYIVSCVYFGAITRQRKVVFQVSIMAVAFSVHAVAFFLLSSDGFDAYALKIYLIGLAVVIFANTLGSLMLGEHHQ
jgi:hypothetical protein